MKKPVVLVLLDGFGYSTDIASQQYNAIKLANTPTWDMLWEKYPHCLLNCSGLSVGLPNGQMGNSEVGHMNIGAGRVVYQDLTRIDQEIANNKFNQNKVFLDLINNTKNNNNTLHICGLISDGGVHSHINHFLAFIKLASDHKLKNLYIHAFLDGRDTPPKSALKYLEKINNLLDDINNKNNFNYKIVSIMGRYYAMDRDNRAERTNAAFDLLTNKNNHNIYIYKDINTAINAAYARSETDEFVKPTIISESNSIEQYNNYCIKNNDNVLFMNFRADRARQLSHKFSKNIDLSIFATLTEYEDNLTDYVAYKPENYKNMLGEYISKNNLTQLRIAETEKYAHVTFFLNGGLEKPFKGEDRILIPSPKVQTYDQKPEMSAYELTEKLCECITSQKYDAIICNYANPDMVGHTGKLSATIKAIEVIDECLANIVKAIDKSKGQLLISADHGNAELMYDINHKQPHTAHTNSLVPFLYYSNNENSLSKHNNLIKNNNNIYSLIDIAPTMLNLMGLEPPKEMTGKIIF